MVTCSSWKEKKVGSLGCCNLMAGFKLMLKKGQPTFLLYATRGCGNFPVVLHSVEGDWKIGDSCRPERPYHRNFKRFCIWIAAKVGEGRRSWPFVGCSWHTEWPGVAFTSCGVYSWSTWTIFCKFGLVFLRKTTNTWWSWPGGLTEQSREWERWWEVPSTVPR